MKILTVGDLHGKADWKIIDPTKYDKIIFIGDLFDSFEFSVNEMYSNALELVRWAEEAKNVLFCIGNHDAHYFKIGTPLFKSIRGSGYKANLAFKAANLYEEHKHLFKLSWLYKNYLWNHAGISQSYFDEYLKDKVMSLIQTNDSIHNIADALNYLYDINSPEIFYISKRRGGVHEYGGPLWADISETQNDPLLNYHQIVGHSKVKDIVKIEKDKNTSITYIDCLDTIAHNFLELVL